MAWAFNVRSFVDSKDAFILQTRRRVAVKLDDDVVAFKRLSNDVTFLWSATVVSVDSVDSVDETFATTRETRIVVRRDERIEQPMELDEYAFSLLKVYRFSHPARHFLQLYTRLPDFDLETLIRGQVFWARTAIGMFASALPRERLLDVRNLIARALPDARPSTELSVAWRVIRDFIEHEYIDVVPLFDEIRDGLRKIESVQAFVNELGIVDDEASRPDLLLRQSALFAELATAWTYDDRSLAISLERRIGQQGDDQTRFEQEFKGQVWRILPIDDS